MSAPLYRCDCWKGIVVVYLLMFGWLAGMGWLLKKDLAQAAKAARAYHGVMSALMEQEQQYQTWQASVSDQLSTIHTDLTMPPRRK